MGKQKLTLQIKDKAVGLGFNSVGISPASEIEEDGFEVGEMSNKLMEKVEELTGGERITPVMVTGDNVEVGFHGVG